ncbi:MAG: hypothetical protein V7L25_23045 [Nostoc sp.]|uniref:hypothetical protein n=1 Tax=Nostoc sp. TaxID=1180 RepID=UPI002FF1559D
MLVCLKERWRSPPQASPVVEQGAIALRTFCKAIALQKTSKTKRRHVVACR